MDQIRDAGVTLLQSSSIVAASAHMNSVLLRAVRMAEVASPMFVVGEMGVGKERIIRLTHSISPGRNQPLVKVNCEAIQEGVLHEVLFGKSDTKLVASSSGQQGLLEIKHGARIGVVGAGINPLRDGQADAFVTARR